MTGPVIVHSCSGPAQIRPISDIGTWPFTYPSTYLQPGGAKLRTGRRRSRRRDRRDCLPGLCQLRICMLPRLSETGPPPAGPRHRLIMLRRPFRSASVQLNQSSVCQKVTFWDAAARHGFVLFTLIKYHMEQVFNIGIIVFLLLFLLK